MREATKEEKESVINYVESISVDTGINFYTIWQNEKVKGGECMKENMSKNKKIKLLKEFFPFANYSYIRNCLKLCLWNVQVAYMVLERCIVYEE